MKKHILTNYLSSCKLNNISTLLPRREKFTKMKDCHIFNVILGVFKHRYPLLFKKIKKYFLKHILHLHSGKSKRLSYWLSVYTALLSISGVFRP